MRIAKHNHFERWYFNFIDRTKEISLWIIVGTQRKGASEQAYIEVYTEVTNKVTLTYPLEALDYDTKNKVLRIGENTFTDSEAQLNIDSDKLILKGNLKIKNKITPTKIWNSEHVMGPFEKLPFLSAYYDLPFLSAELEGSLVYNGQRLDFNEGRAFSQEAWGKKWPNIWIFSKCNHFKNDSGAALSIAIARMELAFTHLTGFAFIFEYQGKSYALTSYNGAHVVKFYRNRQDLHLIVSYKNILVEMDIEGLEDNPLMPAIGHGIKDVYESIGGKLKFKILEAGRVVWEDEGVRVNLEIGGNTSKL